MKLDEFERQAFNYSILVEVGRMLNNFLLAQDFFNFSLEILMECTGRIQGIFFIYSREKAELLAKAYRLYQFSDNNLLLSVFDEKIAMLSVKANEEALHSFEREFSNVSLVAVDKFDEMSNPFPLLKNISQLYGMQEAVPLFHREELKGLVLLGGEVKEYTKDKESPELVGPVVDLLANSIENISLREAAVLDSLTDVYTHRYFCTLLEREIEKTAVSGHKFSVLILDIDNFKGINDTYGHLEGDKVLKRFAEILKVKIRDKIDFIGRYGGDEFLIFLYAVDLPTAYSVAERLRISIKQENFGKVGTVTASIGISGEYSFGVKVEDLIVQADKALYKAKNSGGDAVALSEGNLQALDEHFSHLTHDRYIKDKATAFYSGPYFTERVDGEIKRSLRYRHPLSLVAIRINQLSKIRPSLKRGELELIFRSFANAVLQRFRKGIDIPARFSNEVILFLLPETGKNEAELFAKRILDLLESCQFPIIKGVESLKFNIGICILDSKHAKPEQFIASAVDALEESERVGEGKIIILEGENRTLLDG